MMDLAISLTPAEMERAFYAKDASYNGVFYVAVRTTGIFCLPSCPAKPKRENVEFFLSIGQAMRAGIARASAAARPR